MSENDWDDDTEEEKSPAKRRVSSLSLIKILAVLAAFALIIFAVIKVVQQKPEWFGLSSIKNNQAEVKELTAKVGKIFALPDETPTIATVTDKERLSGQKFFEKAENGDKVLLFAESKQAILYRPSENKIIQVGFININQQPDIEGADKDSSTSSATDSTVSPDPSLKLSPFPTKTNLTSTPAI